MTSVVSAQKGSSSAPFAWKTPLLLLVATLAASSIYLLQDSRFLYLLVYAWFGIGYGIFLQYGRFCMASAVRDLFAVGVPRMAVGVLIAVMLYAIISAFVTHAGFGTVYPHPLGWHILIGGGIFGLGMVLSGGCASSSLYKTGEGNLAAVLVLFSIAFSQAWLVSTDWFTHWAPANWAETAASMDMPEELSVTVGWFDQFTAGYLWQLTGTNALEFFELPHTLFNFLFANAFLVAILPSLVLIGLLYVFNFRKIHLRQHADEKHTLGFELRGIWAMFIQSKNTAIAGLGLGVLAGLHMLITGELREYYDIFNFGELLADMGFVSGLSIQDSVFDPGYWYITTQEAQWAGWAMAKFGLTMDDNIFFGLENGLPNPLLNAPGMMSVGIILGAAMIALARGEFKWKLPNTETAILAIIGGALMGIGSRIGMGCNIGAFFATVTNGDISGWIFLIGMTVGGFLAVKALKLWIDWQMSRQDFDF